MTKAILAKIFFDFFVCSLVRYACYRPQTKFAKVMFLHLSVSHSVHREGGLPQCMLGCHTPGPGTPTPLEADTPGPGTLPPGPGTHPHPPGAETATAADGTHPTGIRPCSFVFSLSLPLSLRVNRPIV